MYKNKFNIFNDYGVIISREGKEIIVDKDKTEELARLHKWHIYKNEPTTNYKKNGKSVRIKMKHIIMNAYKSKKQIYYLNKNPLDNRAENLSYCKNEIIVFDDYAIIKSSDDSRINKELIIDKDMVEKVKQYSWTSHEHGYMFTRVNKSNVFLHNLILGLDPEKDGLRADHIDGNPTNNRRSNLRPATHIENQYNKKKKIKDGITSIYKGVSKKPRSKGWSVSITHNGDYEYLGNYSDEKVAANVYNHYAKKYHGEFASINDVEYMSEEDVLKYKVELRKHTKYRGITYHIHSKKWIASFRNNGEYIHIGSFNNEIEAAKAYNQKVIELNLNKKLNAFD